VDTRVIVMRLRKLDGYLLSLRQVQTVPLEEFLDDDGIQTYVERKLQLAIQVCMDIGNYLIGQLGLAVPDEAENVFARFAQTIVDRFLPGDTPDSHAYR